MRTYLLLAILAVSITATPQLIKCTGPRDCSYHGDCASDKSHCLCQSPYETSPADAFPQCNHYTYNQLESFTDRYLATMVVPQDTPPTFINCTGPADCSYNGDCVSDKSYCVCRSSYLTFPNTNFPQCNYAQKCKTTAFLLEFFLGLEAGAGEWYLENDSIALGQTLLFWVGLVGSCIIGCFVMCCDKEAAQSTVMLLILIIVLTSIIWNIVRWAWIISGHTVDGHGAPLSSWSC